MYRSIGRVGALAHDRRSEEVRVASALLLPGGGYTVQAPLLFYTRIALLRRGVDVRPVQWSMPTGFDLAAAPDWVTPQVAAELATMHRPLLVGKSLGTFAAPLAARDGLRAVWLTPLLNQEAVVAGLRAATAPMLLVGGTDDASWDSALARSLTSRVHEVPGADHNLMVPGALMESARVLGEIVTAIEGFLDEA
jgi:hypothetical protein